MPLPRLPGSGVEKILFSEKFIHEAVTNFFGFRVEGRDQCLGLLGCTNWSLGLDSNDRCNATAGVIVRRAFESEFFVE